MKIIRYQIIML